MRLDVFFIVFQLPSLRVKTLGGEDMEPGWVKVREETPVVEAMERLNPVADTGLALGIGMARALMIFSGRSSQVAVQGEEQEAGRRNPFFEGRFLSGETVSILVNSFK